MNKALKIANVTMAALALVALLPVASPASAQEAKPAAKPAASADGPKFSLDKEKVEVGQVAKGETIRQTFTVKNTGKSDLHINDVKPSCGCTVSEFDKVVKPGAEGKVTLVIDTKNFTGPISKTALILTDDPTNPQATVFVTANVKPFVETFPYGFFRLQALTGEVATSELTIGSDEPDFAPTKAEAPNSFLTVTMTPVPEKELAAGKGKKQFKLVLASKPDAPEGLLTGVVKIQTGTKKQPEHTINISGFIKPTITFSPQVVNFGNFDPKGDAVKRKIMLINNNAKNPSFSVMKAESNVSGVSTEVKAVETDKTRFEVVLTVDEKIKKGVFDGQVVIKTNDGSLGEIKIPIKGVVL